MEKNVNGFHGARNLPSRKRGDRVRINLYKEKYL